MKKTKSNLIIIGIIMTVMAFTLFGCGSSSENTMNTTQYGSTNADEDQGVTIKVGDYVEFGKYYNKPILWRVMEINDDKPLLWCNNILTDKCFDAAESGTATQGNSITDKFGSNVWSNSNIREWLNTSGSVNFSTQPPTGEAVSPAQQKSEIKNSYENEDGFLTGFTQEEKDLIETTIRNVTDSKGNLKETTEDKVFLASEAEVKDGGNWNLNATDRQKMPTEQAVRNDKHNDLISGQSFLYYLEDQNADNTFSVRGVSSDGSIDQFGVYWCYIGIVPALQLSSNFYVDGAGTRDNPWKIYGE